MANSFTRKTERNIGTTGTPNGVGNYTVPSATVATAIGLTLANVSAAAITVSAFIYDGVNSTYLVKNAPIEIGGTLVVIGGDQKVVMITGDSLRVVSSAATSVDAVLSLLEIA